MVQIIENWADVGGVVTAVRSNSDLPGQGLVQIAVSQVSDVDARPNFLKERVGETVDIHLGAQTIEAYRLKPGNHIVVRTRVGGPHRLFGSSKNIRII
jgi:uncharacterized phage protein gp47/JayE